MTRHRISNRRPSDTIDVDFRGKTHAVTYHRDDAGLIREVFIRHPKTSSASEDDARDVAVILSFALQYGAPVEVISAAVTRFDDGSAAGIGGAVLDALAKEPIAPSRPSKPASLPVQIVVPEETAPALSGQDNRAIARMKGYVGESCPDCANFTLVRNGTCLKCDTCGSTTGCS